jgi:hypothetical protein
MKAVEVEVWRYSIFNVSAGWGWVISICPGHLPPGKDLVPIVQQAEWVPLLVWTDAEFKLRAVQSIVKHCGDCAVLSHESQLTVLVSEIIGWF